MPHRSPVRKTRRGAQAVEFALVLPVLTLLVAGTVDYGWYFYQEMNVLNSARNGARAGAATAEGGDPCTTAETTAGASLFDAGLVPSVTAGAALVVAEQVEVGGEQAVEVTIDALPAVHLFGLADVVIPDDHNAYVVMRLEDQDAECP